MTAHIRSRGCSEQSRSVLPLQIFKLSQGEYVAVERIESAYKKLGMIAQIFVYGNSMESVLVAVVVPVQELPLLLSTWSSSFFDL